MLVHRFFHGHASERMMIEIFGKLAIHLRSAVDCGNFLYFIDRHGRVWEKNDRGNFFGLKPKKKDFWENQDNFLSFLFPSVISLQKNSSKNKFKRNFKHKFYTCLHCYRIVKPIEPWWAFHHMPTNFRLLSVKPLLFVQ